MNEEIHADQSAVRRKWSRRHLLMSLLSLGAWLSMRRRASGNPSNETTVTVGGWVLKKSDLN